MTFKPALISRRNSSECKYSQRKSFYCLALKSFTTNRHSAESIRQCGQTSSEGSLGETPLTGWYHLRWYYPKLMTTFFSGVSSYGLLTNGSVIRYNWITDPNTVNGDWISKIHKIQQSVQMGQRCCTTQRKGVNS